MDEQTPQGTTPEPDAAPEATPAAPRVPPAKKTLMLVAAGTAVVLVVAGVVWGAVTGSAAAREQAIRDTATGYLTALAEADAETALGHLGEQPVSTTLLTDEVLAASREEAPLQDVQVTSVASQDDTATARVTYRLGDLPVETELQMTGDGRTSWKLTDGLSELLVNRTEALTVNGATLQGNAFPVFPGTYVAEPTTDRVALAGESRAVVPSPAHPVARIEVSHGLSESGAGEVLAAVKGRFDECLASTESQPAGCPFGVSGDGAEIAPGSVRFQLTNDPWAGFAPALDPATLTASGTFVFHVTATATVTFEGRTGEVQAPMQVERGYSVDLTRDPLEVTWR